MNIIGEGLLGRKGCKIMKAEGVYKHIRDYKTFSIYQDMESGYFVVLDENDNILHREASTNLILKSIDNKA